MPHCIVTTNHHFPPPITTATPPCSSHDFLPTSTAFPPAKFRYTLSYPRTSTLKNRLVICMAKERRVKMVAKQIQRELSDMLLTDQVLQYAILPEAALGADRYLSSLTTISDVEVSSDLQAVCCGRGERGFTGVLAKTLQWSASAGAIGWLHPTESLAKADHNTYIQVVKVYVSVFGDERGKEVAMSGLKSKAKYVRGQLGKRMKLRLTPEIRFIEDESLERGSRVIAILDKIKSEKTTVENPLIESSEPSEDWDDEDEGDDDIIYVK